MTEVPLEVEAAGDHAVERFLRMIKNGESSNMATILACRKFPGMKTETSMVAAQNQQRGGSTLADQFRGNENLMNYRIQQAKKHGYTPRADDFYDSSRARFPGDPRAFTGASQSLGDVRRDMQKTGDGLVAGDSVVVAPETDVAPTPPKKLNERIVTRIQKGMIKENPDLAHQDQRELRSEIKEKHGSNEREAVE